MGGSIAQGHRADNPADDRITAALGENTKRPQHLMRLLAQKEGTFSGESGAQ